MTKKQERLEAALAASRRVAAALTAALTAEEVLGDEAASCKFCGKELSGSAPIESYLEEYWCEPCFAPALAAAKVEADALALRLCKLTREIEVYDPARRVAPSPEQYASGQKEGYTENSVYAHNRHNCTNYDDLIAMLDREHPLDQVRYEAIRRRIDVLLGIAASGIK